MGMAWHEIYSLLQIFKEQQELTECCHDHDVFPGSDPSVMAKPFQDILPFTKKTHRKHTFPWVVCTVVLGAISKNKRKGLGTYRSARLTSDLGKITQPVLLGCINKHVKNKNFKALIRNPQIYQGQIMFSKPGCLLQQSEVCGCHLSQH